MRRLQRSAYLGLGLLSLATGILGLVLPLLPTTVFVLIAAWAFARSSDALHARLLAHPRFGPAILAWQRDGAIPPQAKRLALAGLGISLVVSTIALAARPQWLVLVTAVLAGVAVFILSRPSTASPGTAAQTRRLDRLAT
jgi:uncharacterized membrane protein YbaN (DUF454 family)